MTAIAAKAMSARTAWAKVQLRSVCSFLSGGTPSKQRPDFWAGSIPWVSPKDMKKPRLSEVVDHISEAALANGSTLAPAGSVFVVVRGMILAKDVPVALADVPMAFNQDMKAIIPGPRVVPGFLLYALGAFKRNLHQKVGRSAHGTMTLMSHDLEQFEIPLPDATEQRKIASMLSLVQRAIEQQERLVALTAELKKALLHQLFTRGLRGETQKQTEIGPVPKSWEVVPLRDCCAVQTGIAKGRKVNELDAVTLPYLRVANVQSGFLDLEQIKTITIRANERPRYTLQEGDVVLTEGGDFDKLGRGFIWNGQIKDCVHQNHIFAVRVDRSRLIPEFFAHLSQSAYGKSYFLSVAHKTTNLACINTSKLKGFPVLIPTRDEQAEIVSVLGTLDSKLSVHQRKHSTLSNIFRTLLHELMTAKIRVHDLDLPELEAAVVT